MTDHAPTPELEEQLERQGIPRGSYILAPPDRLRAIIADRMSRSASEVPQFPASVEVSLANVVDARTRHNESRDADVRISINDIVIAASSQALVDVPEVNVSHTSQGVIRHKDADVAFAVGVPGGLMTPIIRQAQRKNLDQIADEAKDLAKRAQTRRLRPDEFTGGTFTVSNLGMFGVEAFGSLVNQPQGAILSVGTSRTKPVMRDGTLAEESVMSVTLTSDHRAIDGIGAARWLAAFKQAMEAPEPLFARQSAGE